MISAYSVVWEPVSAPKGCGEAVRLDNDTVRAGMATPFKEGGHEGRLEAMGRDQDRLGRAHGPWSGDRGWGLGDAEAG
jgi:hypothetical protein